MTATMWDEIKPTLLDMMQAKIDAIPESLLERDGGPVGMKADVILARLIGWDEETVDTWRIQGVVPVLFRAIPTSLRSTLGMEPPATGIISPTAEFVLQSCYATYRLDARYAPADVKIGPPTFDFSVLYVRYKRRS
jgi:hypothetical protein